MRATLTMKLILAMTWAVLLFSCASLGSDSIRKNSYESFQLHTAPDGQVYRIDTQTGQTSWLDGKNFRKVSERTMPELVIGTIYRAEDGVKTYRYLGEGHFEKWGLDRYFISPEKPNTKE